MSAFHPTFVSHAHTDNDLCDRYVAALRARGIDIWYDRDNAQNGHLLGSEIEREIQRRSAFVMLMTDASLNSFWVNLERQTFLGLMASDPARVLLPVRIGACTVPPMLNAFFWIDAQAMPFDKAIDAISKALTATAVTATYLSPPAPSLRHDILLTRGPAQAPANSKLALHLTPMSLYNLGFRGYSIDGVECILPPVCPVPSGVFPMGSDKARDSKARDNEMPQYPVDVAAFAIGQHPVTVAEYACAVRAKAVDEPPKYRLLGMMTDWQIQSRHLDHPVVCIAWDDALVYVRWLARATGQSWRLPTEAEWEKAARGTDGRIYPWGDTFDKARCNTGESGIGTTMPVGSYPGGASAFHAQDMAGNVTEWTSSVYKPYPYTVNDGREDVNFSGDRVLRGGTWSGGQEAARVAFRYGMHPASIGYGYYGIRLAVAGPGSA